MIPPYRSYNKVIRLKLFYDKAPSFFEDFTRAMRGQAMRHSWAPLENSMRLHYYIGKNKLAITYSSNI